MMGFNNIIGHEEIIGHLKNAIESGKISHSYIFTGEPGSGKKLECLQRSLLQLERRLRIYGCYRDVFDRD